MIIQNAILHILDFTSGVFISSQQKLDSGSVMINSYLEKHLTRCLSEGRANRGIFQEESNFKRMVRDLRKERIDFVPFSVELAENIHKVLSESEPGKSFDLLVAQFTEWDKPYLAFLLLDHHMAYTHLVENGEEGIRNQLIQNHAILPGESQKATSFALIALEDLELSYLDRKITCNGEDQWLLANRILSCEPELSNKNILVACEKITRKVAEEFGDTTPIALAKAKNYMVENAETSSTFSPREMGEAIFADEPQKKASFHEKVAKEELPQEAVVEQSVALRKGIHQKIKTDTGIEITFPSEYSSSDEFIEFRNEPDGTIRISLKKIGKITSRL